MLEQNAQHSVVTHMTTIAPKTNFTAAKKLLLALPLLAVLAVMIPSAAHADDYYRDHHHRGYYRHHHRDGYDRHGRYGHRHYRWVHGRHYYYYGDYRPGIDLHIAL